MTAAALHCQRHKSATPDTAKTKLAASSIIDTIRMFRSDVNRLTRKLKAITAASDAPNSATSWV